MIQSPDRVLWTKIGFQHPRQIGYILFPDWLEGRDRHISTALRPMTTFPTSPSRMERLKVEWRVETFLSFLQQDRQIVDSLFGNHRQDQERFFDYVDRYMHEISIGNEGRLIAAVLKIKDPISLIPADLERARLDAVNRALLAMPDDNRAAVDMLYGITSGVPMSMQEVARALNSTEIIARQMVSSGIQALRHPRKLSLLSSYKGR